MADKPLAEQTWWWGPDLLKILIQHKIVPVMTQEVSLNITNDEFPYVTARIAIIQEQFVPILKALTDG